MEGQRIFSVDEANELVPLLALEFERIHRLRRHVGDHFQVLQDHGVEIDPSQPLEAQNVPDGCWKEAVRLIQLVKEIGGAVERMNEAGCLVKDLEVGLVDFYSVIDGEPAYLCWQYGEPEVAYFHPLDEGFRSRVALTGEKRTGILYN
jgi:hypothetical protein